MKSNKISSRMLRGDEASFAGEARATQDSAPEYPTAVGGESSDVAAARNRLKRGRNDPCPCGSGRKYKKCCLLNDEDLERRASAAPEPPPQARSEVDELWGAFDALKQPTAVQMDEFLARLLALPAEATDWAELLHRFAARGHPDLHGVFRRIAGAVPHTKETGMAFFYWAAAEEFVAHDLSRFLPEVAADVRRLDRRSYDPDALSHVEDHLLAGHFDAEALQLAEYFLPVEREDGGLMPYAVPDRCTLIFELRAGACLRSPPHAGASPETIAQFLRQGIAEEIDADAIHHAAGIICDAAPRAWTRAHFELVTGDIRESERAWQECLRLYGTLMGVAREAWQVERFPPGCGYRGLSRLSNAVHLARAEARTKRKNESKPGNLLDYLNPAGMEARVAQACRGMIGVNEPQARLLLDAHEILLRFSARHQLIRAADAAATQTESARLRRVLET